MGNGFVQIARFLFVGRALQKSSAQPILPNMEVSGANLANAALQTLQSAEPTKAKLQMAMLKKTLESEKDQASELLKLLEGKGRTIDIRV